jgi:hypothetical protein
MAQILREVNGENERQQNTAMSGQKLVEVTNAGQRSQMSREEVDALKERNDIRVHDQGDKATILNKLRG